MPTRQHGVENRERVYLQNQFLFSRVLWSHASCLRLLDCRKIIACLQTDKVLFLFSNVKTEKLQRGLVNSKITNLISLPKLQVFCNENAATWRPSLLQSRYSYIIKSLVKRLNQPMTATLIRTTRSLKIYQRNWTDFCKETTSASVHMQEYFYWSNAVTWCLTWKITRVLTVKEWTEDFDARKMEQFVWIPM